MKKVSNNTDKNNQLNILVGWPTLDINMTEITDSMQVVSDSIRAFLIEVDKLKTVTSLSITI